MLGPPRRFGINFTKPVAEMCEAYGNEETAMDKDFLRKRLKCFNASANNNNELSKCNAKELYMFLHEYFFVCYLTGSMRWPEELDLDLSNDLSNNGYIRLVLPIP